MDWSNVLFPTVFIGGPVVVDLVEGCLHLFGSASKADPHPCQAAVDRLAKEMGISASVRASDSYSYFGSALIGRAVVPVQTSACIGLFGISLELDVDQRLIEQLARIKLNNSVWILVCRVACIAACCLPHLFFTNQAVAFSVALVSPLMLCGCFTRWSKARVETEALKYLSLASKQKELSRMEDRVKQNLAIRSDVEDLTRREKCLLNLYINSEGYTLEDRFFGTRSRLERYRKSIESDRKKLGWKVYLPSRLLWGKV